MRKIYFAILFSTAITSCTNISSLNKPSTEQLSGNIIYLSDRDTNLEIYSINLENNKSNNLTNNKSDDFMHSISEDGSKITFVSKRDGNVEVYVMNSDGSNVKRISNNNVNDFEPSLSSDGKRIAYTSENNIYVGNSDGTDIKKLNLNTSNNESPIWSLDNKKIVFRANNDIYLMNNDGSDLKKINQGGDVNGSARFSPDGKYISFISRRDNKWNIYLLEVSTNKEIKLTDSPEDKSYVWSPDSKKIAFVTTLDEGQTEINIINIDGKERKKLITAVYSNILVWSKGGSKLFYSTEVSGNDEIMMLDIETKKESNLTNDKGNDSYPKL